MWRSCNRQHPSAGQPQRRRERASSQASRANVSVRALVRRGLRFRIASGSSGIQQYSRDIGRPVTLRPTRQTGASPRQRKPALHPSDQHLVLRSERGVSTKNSLRRNMPSDNGCHRPSFGMTVVRREAFRHIPGSAGRDWRDVLGSDGLPGAERLRGQEHARKPVTGSRYQGRCAGEPARYGES
jgi:hypothetical protein